MSIAFKTDEDHNGTGQEKLDEMLNKEPLPVIKKGDALKAQKDKFDFFYSLF